VDNFIRKYRKLIVPAALLLIVALTVAARYNLWAKPGAAPAPVSQTAPQAGNISKPTGLVRTGSVESATSVPVNSEFTGRVSEIYVTEGQAVKAGQPLFKLAPSGGDVSRAAANQPAAVQPPAKASYEQASEKYKLYQNLYDQGAISRRQLEAAAAELQAAKEGASSSSAKSSPGGATTLQAPVTIKAPVDGIVTDLTTAGTTVQAGQQVLALGSGQTMEIVVSLEQPELYLVHLGTTASIKLANQTILGQVSSIFPEVKGDNVSAFLAHIKLINAPTGLLKPGMTVSASIDIGK